MTAVAEPTEPTYTYVRGQGWVQDPLMSHVHPSGRWRLEKRAPNPGEFWMYTHSSWDWAYWVSYFNGINNPGTWCNLGSYTYDPLANVVTVVPV